MTDNMMRVVWKTDTKALNLLDNSISALTSESIRETLENRKQYIQDHWSETSPSSPGNPPALVTGALDASLKVIRRDKGGKFATSSNAVSWALTVESEYGAAQEFGRPEINLAPRPFLRPAMKNAESILGKSITTKLQFVLNPFGKSPASILRTKHLCR
jgi:hypothetical protein